MRAITVNQLGLYHFASAPSLVFWILSYSYRDNWQALDKVMDGLRVGRSQGGNSVFWESADVIIYGGKALVAVSSESSCLGTNPPFSDVQICFFAHKTLFEC